MKFLLRCIVCIVFSAGFAIADDDVHICIAEDSSHYQRIAERMCDAIADATEPVGDCRIFVVEPQEAFERTADSVEGSCIAVGQSVIAYGVLGDQWERSLITRGAAKRSVDLSLYYYDDEKGDHIAPPLRRVGVRQGDPQARAIVEILAPGVDIVDLPADDFFAQAKKAEVSEIVFTDVDRLSWDLSTQADESGIVLGDGLFATPRPTRISFVQFGLVSVAAGWKDHIVVVGHDSLDPYLRGLLRDVNPSCLFSRGDITETKTTICAVDQSLKITQDKLTSLNHKLGFLTKMSPEKVGEILEDLEREYAENFVFREALHTLREMDPEDREQWIDAALAAGELSEETVRLIRYALNEMNHGKLVCEAGKILSGDRESLECSVG